MKWCGSLCFAIFICANLAGQTLPQPNPPDITIKGVRWSKGPAAVPREPWPMASHYFPQLESNGSSLSGVAERPVRPSSTRQRPTTYAYSVEIKNGGKAIRAAAWDYVINNRDNGKELSRQPLVSFDRVGRNRSGRLTGMARQFPQAFVDAGGKVRYPNPLFEERVELKCILYQDNSSWCRPDSPPGQIDILRRVAKVYDRW